MRHLVVEADGGSRGNPGPAAYGAVVVDGRSGQVLVELADYLGTQTNNVAEYEGVAAGLAAAHEIAPDALVEARLDSRLVVEQLSGGWAIKNARLRELALRARAIWPTDQVRFTWVPRAQNARADALANRALDAAAAGRPTRIEVWHRGAGDADPYVDAAERLAEGAAAEAAVGGAGAGGAGSGSAEASEAGAAAAGSPGPAGDEGSAGRGEAVSAMLAARAGAAAVRDMLRGERAGEAAPGPGTDAPGGATASGPAPTSAPSTTRGSGGFEPGPGGNRIVGWSRADLGAPTTLLLVRHGVTQHSVEHRFSGRNGADPGLIDLGRRQARAVAEELLRRGGADVLVTSPLRRTRETAAILAERLGVGEPVVVEGLAEADFGAWDSMTFAEVRARWPEELSAWLGSTEVAPPGGESFAAVRRRVEAARLELLERFPRQRVLAVSHVTPIKVLVQQVLEAPAVSAFRFELAPCSLTTLAWWADGPSTVLGMGESGHLHGVLHETA